MSGIESEGGQYARRITLTTEAASVGIGVILLVGAALPSTSDASRAGLLASALLLFVFAALWFHVLPARFLARRRFAIGTVIVQCIGGILLATTGGAESAYFLFFLLPVISTAFAFRVEATLVTGALALALYLAITIYDLGTAEAEVDNAIIRTLGLLSVTALTAMLTETSGETRSALRRRSSELSEQNIELETARTTTVTLSRLRERDEIVRALFDAARRAVGIDRLFLFVADDPDFSSAYTVTAESAPERFEIEPPVANPLRLRVARERRTIVVNDAASGSGISDRMRETYGYGSGVNVPLVHRDRVVGVVSFVGAGPREWTPLELRLCQTIAESSAGAIATQLTFEQLSAERERLAQRTRVLEGLARLSDALAIATADEAIAQASARTLHQSFGMRAATVLFADPSEALLEPAASAGDASPHPVVTGPHSCVAIRSGRLFRVASGEEPVQCPYMPYRAGTNGYLCMPLIAAGRNVGAIFFEPTAASVVDESLIRAASDRVAVTIANQRVLDTAHRQAVTDGLTGLYNRHFMTEQLRLLDSLARRHGRSFCVISLDVDGLKRVNDSLGHEAGDRTLKGFASLLRHTLRGSDLPVRTGGDEFLILLPDTALADATRVAERIRSSVSTQSISEPSLAITVSAGVAMSRPGRTVDELLRAVDEALYEAKRAGRDRVVTEALPAEA